MELQTVFSVPRFNVVAVRLLGFDLNLCTMESENPPSVTLLLAPAMSLMFNLGVFNFT